MAKSDVDFTFNTDGFKNGLKQIAGGIADVSRNTVNMAKNVSKGVINAAAKIGLLKLAFRGVQSAIKEMPEIGKTFKIAKDIIMKNFLFPVRKAIFPMLQKILDWVRDNRAMFVKWGQTLVTVFRVVSKAVSRVIDIGKGLLKTFGDFFNKTFGTQIKGFNDLLNIISFKFAVAVEFLSRLLQPVMDIVGPVIKTIVENIQKIADPIMRIAGNIIDIATGLLGMDDSSSNLADNLSSIVNFMGDIVTFAAEMVDSFVKGLKPHILPIAKTIKDMAKSFKSIFNSIFGSSESMKGWKDLFDFIGNVVGTTLLATFQVIENIVTTIDKSIKSIQDIGNLLSGEKTSDEFGKNVGEAVQGLMYILNPSLLGMRGQKVDDAIIKPGGQVIQTSPEDYLIATKTPGKLSQGKTVTVNLDFTGMNINVANATPEEAVQFSETIVDQVRAVLNRELEMYGGI